MCISSLHFPPLLLLISFYSSVSSLSVCLSSFSSSFSSFSSSFSSFCFWIIFFFLTSSSFLLPLLLLQISPFCQSFLTYCREHRCLITVRHALTMVVEKALVFLFRIKQPMSTASSLLLTESAPAWAKYMARIFLWSVALSQVWHIQCSIRICIAPQWEPHTSAVVQ